MNQSNVIKQQPANTVVYAAPGSGKTTVLTNHVLTLIESGVMSPQDIMAMTFTKQSATDMRSRLLETGRLDFKTASTLRIGTFHAQLFRVLLQTTPDIPTLLSTVEQYQLMARAVESNLKKGAKVTKEEVQKYLSIHTRHQSAYPPLPLPRRQRQVIETYSRLKRVHARWDFDDILSSFCESLYRPTEILTALKDLKYLLIDEFQDTNAIQWSILVRLVEELSIPVFVVGDDDQAIYGFRGASPRYLMGFASQLADVHQHTLTHNFRSAQSIVSTSVQLIGLNQLRTVKDMVAARRIIGQTRTFGVRDEDDEANVVAETIRTYHQVYPNWHFAVLARTRRQLYRIWVLIEKVGLKRVQLRTFHDAKGKEWDMVVIVGLIEDSPYLSQMPSTDVELEEERRLYYVALTRARFISYTFCPKRVQNRRVRSSRFVHEAGMELEVI